MDVGNVQPVTNYYKIYIKYFYYKHFYYLETYVPPTTPEPCPAPVDPSNSTDPSP